jgi:hypothetical protein
VSNMTSRAECRVAVLRALADVTAYEARKSPHWKNLVITHGHLACLRTHPEDWRMFVDKLFDTTEEIMNCVAICGGLIHPREKSRRA